MACRALFDHRVNLLGHKQAAEYSAGGYPLSLLAP
jgi:hypothetical protein